MMLTTEECQAKAREFDIAANSSATADLTASYRRMASTWRYVARQAAWQEAFIIDQF